MSAPALVRRDQWGHRTSTEGLCVGQRVDITARYVGSGRYVNDDVTGPGYIVRIVGDDGVKVARTPDGPWFVYVHACRIA